MFKQRIFLISVVFIIHCFVRPFLISFRVRSSSVLSNAGIFRLTPFYASDEDIKSLYEKAQVEDAEWFQRVLGDNAVIIPEVVPGKVDEKSGVPVQAPTDKLSRAINRDEIKSLNSLGYSNDDITSMKKSIILVVLESNVKRPRKGLPESWLETPSTLNMDQGIRSIPDRKRRDDDSIRDGSGGGKRVIGVETSSQRRDAKLSEGRRGYRDGAYKEDDRRQQEFSRGNSGNRDPFDLEEDTRSERGSKVGEAFAWNGSPLTDEEVDDGQRVRRGVTNEAYQGSSSSSRSSSGRINKNDWDDAKDEDSPSPFWPDVEEFKDMLLDESQWRSDLIGEWSVPLIRQETKWRYKLYKNWLTFLDEGLGDGFDVVDDEFREYYDDDNDDDDNGMNNGDLNPYKNRDGSGDRGSGRDRSTSMSNEPYRDQSETIRDRSRDIDNSRNRPSGSVSQRKINNENEGDNSIKSNRRVELSRAEKYDNWVDQRVGANGIWTNIAEEQWEATKEQRLAAEKRRREEDFDYDDRAQENKQKPKRLSFEDFDDPVKEERRDSRRFESRDDSDGRRFERRDGGGDSNFGERRRERGDEDRREESKGDRKDEIKGDRREATEEGDNWSQKDKRRNPTLQEKSVSSNDYVNEDSFRAAWKASAERSPAGDDDFYSPSPPSINKK